MNTSWDIVILSVLETLGHKDAHRVRLRFYQLFKSESFVGGCSSDPAAFIGNSGTSVTACGECVKWFHQKQSTADQQAHADSLKGSQPEMLSGSEGTYHKCGALPVNTVKFMFFLSFFGCHF